VARGEAWLRRQPASEYTIQIASFAQPERAGQLIARGHWERPIVSVPVLVEGAVRDSVLYGAFPDLRSAREAATRLARASEGKKGWIRGFRTLQSLAAPVSLRR